MNHPTAPLITLDHNGQLPVQTKLEGVPAKFTLTIDLNSLSRPDYLINARNGHFILGATLLADGADLGITPEYYYDKETGKQLIIEGVLPAKAKQLSLHIYGEPVVTLLVRDGQLVADTARLHERLNIDELRILGTSRVKPKNVPASRALFAGYDPALHAPITELHTHSSAQLSAEDLIVMALKHQLTYPTELLEKKLNISFTAEEQAAVLQKGGLGMRFSPGQREGLKCEQQNEPCDVIPLSALTPEHLARLQSQLQIPQDATICFTDFDRIYYRFVNPIVKNPATTEDLLMHIARDYQRHGIRYAELSTAAMLNLDENGRASWFAEMISSTARAEQETGVQLRYLIGIPRGYSPAQIMTEAEKIKYAIRHPLIVGCDVLGYEAKSIDDLMAVLMHIANWASAREGTDLAEPGWDFQKDCTIRLHTSETGKNRFNMATAIPIAEHYGVPLRFAHAVNEAPDAKLDRKIRELSSQYPPLVSIELCPSSNIAYNNIRSLTKVQFKRWAACCNSLFLSSDGAGAIQTDPEQLGLTALSGGMTVQQLAQMRAHEEKFIAFKQQRHDTKSVAYQTHYGKNADEAFLKKLAAHIQYYNDITDPKTFDPVRPRLPKKFDNKMPIFIGGSAKLDKNLHSEIRQLARMTVAAADPQKVFFVFGRSKDYDVVSAFDEAILEHNRLHPRNKFKVLALITKNTADVAWSTDWIVPQAGELDQVPENIAAFMRHHLDKGKIPGIGIFIGGTSFTGDMIKKFLDSNLALQVMENVPGASQDWAEDIEPEERFHNGRSLLKHIGEIVEEMALPIGSIFRAGIDLTDSNCIQRLESDARKRVKKRITKKGD